MLPPPPQNRSVLQNMTNTFADSRAANTVKDPGDHNSKLQTLKAYRRARGLSFTCGEKWGPDHKCLATIQLHIVEELLDFMGPDVLGLEEQSAESRTTK